MIGEMYGIFEEGIRLNMERLMKLVIPFTAALFAASTAVVLTTGCEERAQDSTLPGFYTKAQLDCVSSIQNAYAPVAENIMNQEMRALKNRQSIIQLEQMKRRATESECMKQARCISNVEPLFSAEYADCLEQHNTQ